MLQAKKQKSKQVFINSVFILVGTVELFLSTFFATVIRWHIGKYIMHIVYIDNLLVRSHWFNQKSLLRQLAVRQRLSWLQQLPNLTWRRQWPKKKGKNENWAPEQVKSNNSCKCTTSSSERKISMPDKWGFDGRRNAKTSTLEGKEHGTGLINGTTVVGKH